MCRRRGVVRLPPNGQPEGFPSPDAGLPLGVSVSGYHPARGSNGPVAGIAVTRPLLHQEFDATAADGVRNSQPEGIGRMVALDGLVCWNNLGRNGVFADRRL